MSKIIAPANFLSLSSPKDMLVLPCAVGPPNEAQASKVTPYLQNRKNESRNPPLDTERTGNWEGLRQTMTKGIEQNKSAHIGAECECMALLKVSSWWAKCHCTWWFFCWIKNMFREFGCRVYNQPCSKPILLFITTTAAKTYGYMIHDRVNQH